MKEAYVLKDEMEKDERVINLKKAEKAMENCEDVMRLSYAFSCAQDEYNDILKHFEIDSAEAKKYQKKLFEVKRKLDEHPLVKNYLQHYQKVRLMYEDIQESVFRPFTKGGCIEKR